MGLRVAFRVDATPSIGLGHFMRCLTLARALPLKSEVLFISRGLPEELASLTQSFGYRCEVLNAEQHRPSNVNLAHSQWLTAEPLRDAWQTASCMSGGQWDWLVVDHYALDAHWESEVRGKAKRLMVIDDLADRQHLCDILVDQNLALAQDSRYVDLVPLRCTMLLGPSYALLRPSFRSLRTVASVRVKLNRILIFFGGFDKPDLTSAALDAIEQSGVHVPQIEVAIGSQHWNRSSILNRCRSSNIDCHVQSDKIAELMLRADLSFGASGSTSWERCCLGLPAVCAVTAQNQLMVGQSLAREGAALLVGEDNQPNINDFIATFLRFTNESTMLPQMSAAASNLVDGLGTRRVVDAMLLT